MKLRNFLFALDVNVKDLLSKDSAALGEGGSLEEANKLVMDYGAGINTILNNLLVYVAGAALIVGAIVMIVNAGNTVKRGESRVSFLWIIVGVILGFAGVGIIIFAQKIGTSLFG